MTTTTVDVPGRQVTEVVKNGTTPYSTTESTIYSTGALKTAKNTDNQSSSSSALISDYLYNYDAMGQVTNQHMALGALPGKQFDLAYINDSFGSWNKTDTRTIKQNGNELLSTTNLHDRLGRIDKIFETPVAGSNLHAKAVDFTFSGPFLEEIKRFNANDVSGTAVSNSAYGYDANRSVDLMQNKAIGFNANLNQQAVHYDKWGRVKKVVDSENTLTTNSSNFGRDEDGKIAQINNDENVVAQSFVYNGQGERAGIGSSLGQVTQDGNSRYKYDAEGNVITQMRYKTETTNRLNLAEKSKFHGEDGSIIYDNFVFSAKPEIMEKAGWYRFQFSPLRVTSSTPLTKARITVHLYKNDGVYDTAVVNETMEVDLVKVADDSYAISNTYSWDKYIPAYGNTNLSQYAYYMDFKLELLTPSSITGTFKVDGSLSLDQYDTYLSYQYDNKNRMTEAKEWRIDANNGAMIQPRLSYLLGSEKYQYDALGNRVSVTTTAGGGTENRSYVFENGHPLLEFSNEKLERERLYASAIDQILAVEDLDFDNSGNPMNGETIWTLSDYQGTITGLYVSEGRYERLHYDSFGNRGESTGVDFSLGGAVKVGYLGLEFDATTGLYLDGVRSYDAAGGRYLSPSSYVNGISNIYAFANNSPVDRSTSKVHYDFTGTPDQSSVGTRIFGGVQAAFGAVEMYVGGTLCIPTVGLGCFAAGHGADNFATGVTSAIYGVSVDTSTKRVAAWAASGVLSESNSQIFGTVVDVAFGLISPTTAAAWLGKAATSTKLATARNAGQTLTVAPISAAETTLSRGAYLRQKYAHYTPGQRIARIEELSMGNRVLREAGVPSEYVSSALQSFEPGTITTRIAGEADFGLRFYGGVSGPKSPYLSPTFPLGNVRQLSAPPAGNTLESIMQWQVRPGTPLLEGRVRAAFGQPGGGRQMYVPNFFNNLLPAN